MSFSKFASKFNRNIMENTQKEEKKENKTKLIILYILIGSLAVTCGVLSWLLFNVKQDVVYITQLKEVMVNEKNALDGELKDMLG